MVRASRGAVLWTPKNGRCCICNFKKPTERLTNWMVPVLQDAGPQELLWLQCPNAHPTKTHTLMPS